uniref:Uncharacterized protein n=1 Tax=Arundo donax TaxID=35708 RepID=A0A0A9BHN6_ARUDO
MAYHISVQKPPPMILSWHTRTRQQGHFTSLSQLQSIILFNLFLIPNVQA